MFKAYFDLFENDLMVSLKSRLEEMIPGGRIVLNVTGSDRKADISGNQGCAIWKLLGSILMTLS
ncbi:hypothetical protein SADUNF_Sadunf09G0096800 [Salix dunnii]|uniref:Uncharacterized protein n=1 Tax=Salix dunnii TaxID=1413687 RepID=A0A835JWM7_9ROSI|nr:hypothetical protein SADUNF_Sadunf09G0096800 [Salix dunnii]